MTCINLLIIFKLQPVGEAFFASTNRATGTNPCLPRTHVPALQTIRDWVNSDLSSPLFWLCGSAGSGKSTIAYTIAQECSDSGASFFFSRARLSLRESRLVFQTIAFQLRNNYPLLRAPISRALEDRSVLTANSEAQFQKFILNPILQTQAHLPDRLVIVIDALDECDDNIILNVIGVLAPTLEKCDPFIRARLRFLVTSRPEKNLVEFFTKLQIPSFDMSNVNPEDKKKDICIFLKDELRKLSDATSYELDEEDVQLLAKISGGVFIAARIAVDFVAFGKSPISQLRKLRNAGHLSGLDVVYRLVLDDMAEESLVWDILQPIGTIVLSFSPLSREAISDLLRIGPERLDRLLDALRPVIHVRKGDAIYPIHASLRDFLTDPDRCTDSRIFVDPIYHHSMISRACFDRMTSLLQEPDLRDMGRDGKKFLPESLTYVCQYWPRHLAESNLDQSLVDRLDDFASARLLYWIERLRLVGDLDLGISGLGIVISVLVASVFPMIVNTKLKIQPLAL